MKPTVLGLLAIALLAATVRAYACDASVCVQTYNFDLTSAGVVPPFARIKIVASGGGALSDLRFSLFDKLNAVGLVRTVVGCCDDPLVDLTDPEALDGQFSITVSGLTFSSDWYYGAATGYASPTEELPNTGPVVPQPVPQVHLELKSTEVAGCKSVMGVVTILNPAPAGGRPVYLSDKLTSASVPNVVTVPEGAVSKSFFVNTAPVAVAETGSIKATLFQSTSRQDLTVRPMGLQSLTLAPTPVAGSQPVVGKATLECRAGPGPVIVDLSSSNPAVANPIAASIAVPQGLQSAAFDVATSPVLSKLSLRILGATNGTTRSRLLTVTAAAAVSPTSLKFGNVAVGGKSGVLTTMLTNKGAAAIFVDSIGITGSYASWFSLTNSCPSSLAAGASCTISVTFTPQAALSKLAKLTIATSATSTPLSVSLSGTGI